jgi:hypothetical protein
VSRCALPLFANAKRIALEQGTSETPWHKCTGVLAFLPRFLTAFEAIRLLCGSTRLLSRWTLALIQIWASEANASSVVHYRVPRWGRRCSLSRPPPASGRCRVTPTERAPCLLASWNKYSTYVQIVQGVLPAGSGFFIPRLQRRGLSNPILGNP